MNNSFSLQHIQKTNNLDANLISRQNKQNLKADFMRLKYENPGMKHSQIANQKILSTSTLQRYRNDTNMLSPYRINPINTNKQTKKTSKNNCDNNSQSEHDPKKPQMTSNDLKRHQSTSNAISKKVKTKNNLKCGLVQENVEINEHYLDENLHNNHS